MSGLEVEEPGFSSLFFPCSADEYEWEQSFDETEHTSATATDPRVIFRDNLMASYPLVSWQQAWWEAELRCNLSNQSFFFPHKPVSFILVYKFTFTSYFGW